MQHHSPLALTTGPHRTSTNNNNHRLPLPLPLSLGVGVPPDHDHDHHLRYNQSTQPYHLHPHPQKHPYSSLVTQQQHHHHHTTTNTNPNPNPASAVTATPPPTARMSQSVSSSPYPPASHANPPPPPLTMGTGPPMQGPSVIQILQMGQERNHAADAMAHHPRIESLVKLAKESEATWLQMGGTAEALGDLDRAVASYESALRHNAYSIPALSHIAAICRSKEEFKKAAEYFGRVVGIAPESGEVWGALGHCYLMIDDLKKAYSSYQQALYYMPNPQEPKLWYGIGILYDRYGSLEHAEEAFSSVIRMDQNFEKANEIFFRLGIIYKQQRKSQQSLECFRYILSNPPRPLTEIDIWFQIGHVYEQQKDFVAAKESYDRVLAENPAHAKVLQQLGGLYHRVNAPFYNPDVSVQILTKSLESDANDPFSWYLLGRAYMTTNNYGKAYEAYQQAVYRDGKNPAFWCSIGVLYYNINQFHDALDAYSRAIRIHPYLSEVWFNLGALYESCNDQMTDAIDAYQRTLQLEPGNNLVAARLREIREHQTSGTPLSAPPQPKDISPSSVSWNYATNTPNAAQHLSQSGGLGLDLSPALGGGRSSENGVGSPPNGHRFEGPGRPHSTDSFRADERRRLSAGQAGQHSPTAADHSPRSAHRLSGPSQNHLPQIKSLQDARGSPPASLGSEIHRRHSPLSPRSRHSETFERGGGGYGAGSQNGYHGGPPSSFPSSYPRGGAESGERATEMDWERSRNGSASGPGAGGRGSTASHRRSPPGSSHSRDFHPPPPAPSTTYERHIPSPGGSRPNERDDRSGGGSPYPPPFPYGYNNGAFDSSRRYDPRGEQPEDDDRRRSSVARPESPRAPPPAPTQGPSDAGGSTPTASGPSTNGKGKGGRSKKEDGTASPAGARKEAAPKPRKGKDAAALADGSNSTSSVKKERKVSSSKAKDEGGRKVRANGTPKPASPPASTSPPELPVSATEIAPPPPASSGPSREVDEDYDEGVDALMGLASSGSTSSHDREPTPPARLVAATSSAAGPSPTMQAAAPPPLPALPTSSSDAASKESSLPSPPVQRRQSEERALDSPSAKEDAPSAMDTEGAPAPPAVDVLPTSGAPSANGDHPASGGTSPNPRKRSASERPDVDDVEGGESNKKLKAEEAVPSPPAVVSEEKPEEAAQESEKVGGGEGAGPDAASPEAKNEEAPKSADAPVVEDKTVVKGGDSPNASPEKNSEEPAVVEAAA
ncbi:hypothetical protein T439DRAFT_351927 [Meredithblackwellia eburnea MCA 4105]